jgi:tetratricopeptide (TPR) repeat protein
MSSSEKNRKILESAKRYFHDKNYREAIEICEHAIANGCFSEELILLCGTSALYEKDLESASRHADAILDANFNNSQALVLKALAIRNRDPQRALALLDRALRFNPQSNVIQEYRYRILNRMYDQTTLNLTEAFQHTRKWIRAKMARDIQIPGLPNAFDMLKTVSLSAGGCLVEATDLPERFQFTLNLKETGTIGGTAALSYVEKNRYSGMRFVDLSSRQQGKIDYEVRLTSK